MDIFGYPIWVVLLVCFGVFCASFMDAIGGGGGIISLPTYLLAGLPMHFALGTNKLSSCIGTVASTVRYIKNGYVDWFLGIPSIALALAGAHLGTRLHLAMDEQYLKLVLLFVLPVIAVILLRKKDLPETRQPLNKWLRGAIVWSASLVFGTYDGFYGPGTGTFLIIAFTVFAKLDIRTANAQTKIINLTTNITSLTIFLLNGQAVILLGLAAAACNMAGNYVGASLAMTKGSKITRPVILLVLVLLFLKVLGII